MLTKTGRAETDTTLHREEGGYRSKLTAQFLLKDQCFGASQLEMVCSWGGLQAGIQALVRSTLVHTAGWQLGSSLHSRL